MMVTTGGTNDAIGIHLGLCDFLGGLFFEGDLIDRRAELARHLFGKLRVERLVDGGEYLLLHQFLDDQVGFDAELFGKFFDGDTFRNGDFAVDNRQRFLMRRGPTRSFPSCSSRSRGACPLGLGTALINGGTRGRQRRRGMHRASAHGGVRRVRRVQASRDRA
jgi:hypothetical protein